MVWIQTRKGRRFDLLNPRSEDVDPEEVAYALARINRYTGHANTGYIDGRGFTVAQHCVMASRAIRGLIPPNLRGTLYEDPIALEALVHDAGEAYTGDVSAPMKAALRSVAEWNTVGNPRSSDFDIIEAGVWVAVAKAFGVPVKANPLVKLVDLRMLATEARQFMAPLHPDWTSKVEPFQWEIRTVWDPATAATEWMIAYRTLTERIQSGRTATPSVDGLVG